MLTNPLDASVRGDCYDGKAERKSSPEDVAEIKVGDWKSKKAAPLVGSGFRESEEILREGNL